VRPREAVALQRKLALRAEPELPLDDPRLVAGVDVSYFEHRARPTLIAGVVVVELPSLEVVETASFTGPTTFPYVPGLLSFREIPAVLEACRKIRSRPDAVICDGHGRAHPRRFGLACHLGLCLRLPTVGCAKSLLLGSHEPLPDERGRWRKLVDGDETVGAALRTRAGVKPVYVSCGYGLTLRRAIGLVLRSTGQYRLPEPTRRADLLVSRLRRESFASCS